MDSYCHVSRTCSQMRKRENRKILAVSSGGGHWVQLLRLRPAFDGCNVYYTTVRKEYQQDIPNEKLLVITDGTRWNKFRLVIMALQLLWIMLRIRPDIVVSTGAAPGYFAFRIGKLFGARTLWIDSIANVEHVSMTCNLIAKYADMRLTQWEHLAMVGGPEYRGSVI